MELQGSIPLKIMEKFNPYIKSVIVRVSEAKDQAITATSTVMIFTSA
jgi:hypothetical protein